MRDLAVTGNVKSAVTDPHRRKDFLDPTEIKTFLDAAKAAGKAQGIISLSDDVPPWLAVARPWTCGSRM